MQPSSRRIRRALWLGGSAAAAVALTVAGVTSSVAAAPASLSSTTSTGPGYPPPKGIYAPFTNCPLKNPLMQESLSGDATGCVAGDAATGSITIGTVTVANLKPVIAQFGIWDPPNAVNGQFDGGTLPPPAGISAELATAPDLVPASLTTALGCPSSDPTVENLCQEAQQEGGAFNQVFALAQEAGALTNFELTTWTQPVKFKLINPLLGNNCYIGSNNSPVMIHPDIVSGTLGFVFDPDPTAHPNTVVLSISNATATDTTFTAPGVIGCGPGGSANIAVDEALDAGTGLPAASGTNSLTLSGTFFLADNFNSSNQANILLNAFQASTSGEHSVKRHISFTDLPGHFGFK
jgi:hypothetical protein